MRRLLILLALLTTAGCASAPGIVTTTLITPTAEGLPAILMTRTVAIPGPIGNRWELPAGGTFVQDRVRASDGAALWCGVMISEEGFGYRTCMTRDGQDVEINAANALGGWRRTLPADSYREFRMR
jgi:hypothetical protein